MLKGETPAAAGERDLGENLNKLSVETRDRASLLETCLTLWQYAEHSDARRQSTYFKSRYQSKALFFDITSKKFKSKIFKIIDEWYNKL